MLINDDIDVLCEKKNWSLKLMPRFYYQFSN